MRTTNAMQPAQTLDTIQSGHDALSQQLASNLLGAVDPTAKLMRRFDGNDQAHIVEFTR